MATPKISIITIVYDKEYPLLFVQARSLARFVDPELISEVVWITNHSREDDQSNTFFLHSAKKEIEALGVKLILLSRTEVTPFADMYPTASGWKHQQALKILASKISHSKHYMLLDAKNCFCRPVNASTIYQEGKVRSFYWRCSEPLKKWLGASMEVVGLSIDLDEPIMPTATPYIMVRQHVLDMLEELGDDFWDRFYQDLNITEFFVYYAYLKSRGLVEPSYWFSSQFYATIFRTYPATESEFSDVETYASREDVFSLGFHLSRFEDPSSQFREFTSRLWLSKGILATPFEVDVIFTSLKT